MASSGLGNGRVRLGLYATDDMSPGLLNAAKSASKLEDGLKNLNGDLATVQRSLKKVDGFNAAISKTKKYEEELESARERLKGLQTAMDQTQEPTSKLTQDFSNARYEVTRLERQFSRAKAGAERQAEGLKTLGIETKDVATATEKLTEKKNILTEAIDRQSRALDRAQKREAAGDRLRAKARDFAMTGRGLIDFGSGIIDKIKAPLTTAIDFEAQMSRVEAKAFGDEKDPAKRKLGMAGMRKEALRLGAQTSYSASEVAQAQEELAGAGFDPESIAGVTGGVLTMAKAGDLDLGRAADLSTGIINMYDLKKNADDIKMIGDILAKTAADTKTDMSEMAEVFKYAGTGAKMLGVDLAHTAALTGALADANIKGSEAGTALRAILSRLAAPTKEAGMQLANLGIKTKDSKGNFRDVNALMSDLARNILKKGSADQIATAKSIAGEEAANAFLAILKKTKEVREVEIDGIKKHVSGLEALSLGYSKATGYAERMANIMGGNTKGSIDELSSSVESLNIGIGHTIAPTFKTLTNGLTKVISRVSDLVSEWPKLTTGIVGGVAIIAGLTVGLGALGLGLAAITSGLGALEVAIAFLGPWTVAIAGVSAGVWALSESWDWLKNVVLDVVTPSLKTMHSIQWQENYAQGFSQPNMSTIPKTLNVLRIQDMATANDARAARSGQQSVAVSAPINITLNKDADPAEIGRIVQDHVERAARSTKDELDRRQYD